MTIFRIRYERRGGHIHMRLFSAKQPNMTFAKLGDLCCAESEFTSLQLAMSGVAFLPEEPLHGGPDHNVVNELQATKITP